ncbi:hypothetical protein F4777DRAFT_582132 [Nemania sp. FL0916]|nr:hypothetical protein F4777DRAFT_582132 [Nemania sp. FL0916]
MADELTSTEGFSKKQPCLDFIETRLPKYHEAFANPHVRFNIVLGRYDLVIPVSADSNIMKQQADDEQLRLLPESPVSESTRQPFWESMLPKAMAELKNTREEPSRLVGTLNSIRGLTQWAEVVNVLEVARARYYNYSGFVGFWKRAGHKMTDYGEDGKLLLSLLPNSDYTSLIHCVFDVIFDAAKRTAEIREEIEESLRQFREKLEDVEGVVAIYVAEDDIVAAAMNVLVSILRAIEDILDYYSAKKGSKIVMALWQRNGYKADLSECLGEIDSSGKRLIEKSNISNFRETHAVNIKASEGLERLKALQLDQLKFLKGQTRLAKAQQQMTKDGQKIRAEQQRLARDLNREASANEQNAAANAMNATANMANAMISAVALNNFNRLSEEYLVAMNEKERIQRLNAQLRAKNARLSSALQVERSRSRGRSPSPIPEVVSQSQLLRMLNIPNVENADIAHIADSASLIDRNDQGRAENLITHPQFQQWVVQTQSTELLVHGHMKPSRTSISALSLFSAAIVRNLQKVDRFRVVTFFCGQHSDMEDPLAGGAGLIKSLIEQLLYQHRFDSVALSHVAQIVNLALLDNGYDDIEELCRLFVSLVHQLPSNVTLFCVLDSVNMYEDPEYMHDMHVEKVLYEVLSLTRDNRVRTHVKVLLTSPTDTDTIRQGFREEDILSMSGQPKMGKFFDDDRFAQQAEYALSP